MKPAMQTPVALSISGSDPSGGAGLQADLKVFACHGVYGMAAVSLITVQNTVGVERVEPLDPELVVAQARAVCADIPPRAIKTGSLGSAQTATAVAAWLAELGLRPVVDPVLVSKHGDPLAAPGTVGAFARSLVPLARLLTPNLAEAAALLGEPLDPDPNQERRLALARGLLDLGADAVLLKDGGGVGGTVTDLFLDREGTVRWHRAPRLATRSTHGSGCALSAAIAARLARGEPLVSAVAAALPWLHRAIARAPDLGSGRGPLELGLPPSL